MPDPPLVDPSIEAPLGPTPAAIASPSPSRRLPVRRMVWIAALAIGLAGGLLALRQWWTWPAVTSLAREKPPTTAFIEHWRARQRAAGRADRVDWRWVSYERIAAEMKIAAVVAEDIEFFSHHGFSQSEIRTAIEEAWEEGRAPRGASTISQQVAKNLWLSPSRNPWRKVKEALLTRQLEAGLTKRRILEIYLNVAEFGPGVYGVEAAARRYFSKSAAELDGDEAARLAAGLPKPSAWNPASATPYARRRAESVRRRMEKAAPWLRREI